MALIKCKECGKEISSQAESCPNCGLVKKSSAMKALKVIALLILVSPLLYGLGYVAVIYYQGAQGEAYLAEHCAPHADGWERSPEVCSKYVSDRMQERDK